MRSKVQMSIYRFANISKAGLQGVYCEKGCNSHEITFLKEKLKIAEKTR